MIREHTAAIKALLTPLPFVKYGELDDIAQVPITVPPQTPYVVVRTNNFPVQSDRLVQWSSNVEGLLYVTCVGGTLDEVQWAQEKTRTLLVDVVPVVAGRSVAPLHITDGQPVQADRDVTPPLLFAVDVYRFCSYPG